MVVVSRRRSPGEATTLGLTRRRDVYVLVPHPPLLSRLRTPAHLLCYIYYVIIDPACPSPPLSASQTDHSAIEFAQSGCPNPKEYLSGYNDAEYLVDLVTEADLSGKSDCMADHYAK